MELSSKMPPVQVIHINLLFRSEKNVSDDLDYAYSGLSCNMSSTCYGGVYQGEYTPTEVTKLFFPSKFKSYSYLAHTFWNSNEDEGY